MTTLEFWQSVYIAATRAGIPSRAKTVADQAVKDLAEGLKNETPACFRSEKA